MSTLGLMPSLAQATSTHLDSACKHIQQCRVSQDHMTKFLHHRNPPDPDELIRNKYRYCVHKDELVLGVGKCWAKDGSDKKYQNNAYPRVVSNLGGLADMEGEHESPVVRLIKVMYHNATSIPERNAILRKFQDGHAHHFHGESGAFRPEDYLGPADESGRMRFADAIPKIHDFITVGYANTLGWAHAHTGDTMTSVMIGGLRTVMNGDFEVFTGDLIQWYWPFERMCFNKKGARKPRKKFTRAALTEVALNYDPCKIDARDTVGAVSWSLDKDSLQRKQFFDQQYGDRKGREKTVAQIKPYKRDDEEPRLYDWYRVFAVALCSARPREKVDIRICRQAL